MSVSVGAIVDQQPVVAVNAELFETDEELFQNGLCLEGHYAVEVALVPRHDDSAVHLARHLLPETIAARTALAQPTHRN